MSFFRNRAESFSRDLTLLGIVFGTLFFQCLGRIPLIEPDEGRYVEIPREMLERGDFITPTLNYVKYFEKPPLHYWLNALSLVIFGENPFAARFVGTLCGLGTVLLAYCLGRELYGRRSALFASILLGCACGFMVQSRINITDMTLTFFLSAAFSFFVLASREGARHKARDYYLFYAFMGLSVLAKGLIGIVLPGGVILCYLLATRRWEILREMRIPSGILLFLAICAPWFVLVSLKNPEFPHFFFIHEHFQRFLTKVHHRYQPVWFFIPVLALTMLPWSMFLPAALAKGWRERREQRESFFLLLWAGVIFAFFSKSNSKLIPYILPVFPPLALLAGNWFAAESTKRSVKRHAAATGGLLIVLGAAVILCPRLSTKSLITPEDGAIVGGLLLLQGVGAFLARRGARQLFATLAATGYLFALLAPPVVYQRVAQQSSVTELALAINRLAPKEATIACYSGYDQAIPFYTHRRVMVVGDRDELDFGSRQGDHSAWYLEPAAFHVLWDTPKPIFATIKRKHLQKLTSATVTPVRVVAVQGDRLLVCNQRPRPKQLPASSHLSPR